MICRIWTGVATAENAPKYEHLVRGVVIPAIEARRLPGFLSIDLMKRQVPHGTQFQTIMWFEDISSIVDFVGDDSERSHVPPEARALLSSFDERAVHFEVLERRSQPGS